jgi:hypothetical protein
LISNRPATSVTPEIVRVSSSTLCNRMVADFIGALPASRTTVPVTLHSEGFTESEAGLRDCPAAIEADRSPSKQAKIHFIPASVGHEYTPAGNAR